MRNQVVVAAALSGCISVPPATSDGSTGNATTTSTAGATSSTGDAPTTADATTADATTADVSTTDATTLFDSTGTWDTEGLGTSTGSTSEILFEDDFDRPDSEEIGNGWVEKTQVAYALQNGMVVGSAGGPQFFDSLWYRPSSESVADVEMTIRFRLNAVPTSVTPQLHARMQPDSATVGTETAYLGYAANVEELRLGSVIDGSLSPALETPIVPPLEAGTWYRLRVRVSGADPVQLFAAIDEQDGNRWLPRAEVSGSDTTPTAITTPGNFGVSGHLNLELMDYDDFEARVP